MLRLGGGVAGVADSGEGAVGDAPGGVDVEGALLADLWLMVLLLMPLVRALQVMLRSTVSLVMMMMRVLQVVLVWVRVCVLFGLCFGAGRRYSWLGAWWAALLAGRPASQSCWRLR